MRYVLIPTPHTTPHAITPTHPHFLVFVHSPTTLFASPHHNMHTHTHPTHPPLNTHTPHAHPTRYTLNHAPTPSAHTWGCAWCVDAVCNTHTLHTARGLVNSARIHTHKDFLSNTQSCACSLVLHCYYTPTPPTTPTPLSTFIVEEPHTPPPQQHISRGDRFPPICGQTHTPHPHPTLPSNNHHPHTHHPLTDDVPCAGYAAPVLSQSWEEQTPASAAIRGGFWVGVVHGDVLSVGHQLQFVWGARFTHTSCWRSIRFFKSLSPEDVRLSTASRPKLCCLGLVGSGKRLSRVLWVAVGCGF